MWTAIATIAAAAMGMISKLLGRSSDSSQRDLGRAEQQNADMKGDLATVRAATEAAKKAETNSAPDPNDLDARR